MDPATMAMIAQMFSGGGGQGGGGQGGAGMGGMGGGGGFKNPLGQIVGGLFGNSGAPYEGAEKELNDFYNRGKDTQQPFLDYGKGAMPKVNEWLGGMKDPSGFINKLMGQYSESPWAKYQQDQSARRFGNAGSASGLTGSTPLGQFEQQSMHDITSEDQQKWLQNVLGINSEYGKGIQNQVNVGQGAANSLTDLNKEYGKDIAEMQYGKKAGENQDRMSIIGGLFG